MGDRGSYQAPEDPEVTKRMEEEKKADISRQANEDKAETARLENEKEKEQDKEK